MSNACLQKEPRNVKTYLTSPYKKFRIILKEGVIYDLMRVKGWKNLSQVAEELGFTRQYIHMLVKAKVSASAEFITRLAACLGSIDKNWHVHFMIVPCGNFHENHPTWNMQKHDGKIPYRRYSTNAEHRKKDYSVEEKIS